MRVCPICKRSTPEPDDNPTRPFCSDRCKLVDLGNWLGDGYRIDQDAPPVPIPRPREDGPGS